MAAEFPLSLIIRAVDKATAPLRAVNERIRNTAEPVRRLNNSFRALGAEAGFGRVASSLKGVTDQVGGLALKFLGLEALSVGALYHVVRGSVEAGEALFLAAKRVGMTVDAYAQLRFAASKAGVEQEQFTTALDRFNRGLGEAKAGTGKLYSFLQQVSPRLAEQVRGAKSTEDAFKLMTRAFEHIKDPAKIAALSTAVFGRGAVEMGQFLHEGSEEIEKQRKRFVELAGSKAKSAAAARELAESFKEMDVAMGGLRGALVVGLYPGVLAITQALTSFMAQHRDSIVAWAKKTGAAISQWVADGGIQRLIGTLERLAAAVSWVVDKLGGIEGVATIVATFIGVKVVASFAAAAHAVWALGAALLATPAGWIIAAIAAIAAAVYLIVKHWGPIKKFFGDLWDGIVGIFQAAWDKVRPIVDGVMSVVSPVANIFGGGGGQNHGAATGADAALGGRGRSQAHVVVDFNNAPPGTRATTAPQSTADLDLSMGYSLVTP